MTKNEEMAQAIQTLLGYDTTPEDILGVIKKLSYNYSMNFIAMGKGATGDSDDVTYHLLLLKDIEENLEKAINEMKEE